MCVWGKREREVTGTVVSGIQTKISLADDVEILEISRKFAKFRKFAK